MLERDVFRASLFKPLVIGRESSRGACANNNALEQIPFPPPPSLSLRRCERGIPITRLNPLLRIPVLVDFGNLSRRDVKKPPLFVAILRTLYRCCRLQLRHAEASSVDIIVIVTRKTSLTRERVRSVRRCTCKSLFLKYVLMEQGTATPGMHQLARHDEIRRNEKRQDARDNEGGEGNKGRGEECTEQ